MVLRWKIAICSLIVSQIHYWEVLNFDDRVEFDEGDIGLVGAIQVIEPVTAHNFRPSQIDCIIRYAGEAGPDLPWPASNHGASGERSNKKERLERLLLALERNMQKTYRGLREVIRKTKSASGIGGSSMGGSMTQSRAGSGSHD